MDFIYSLVQEDGELGTIVLVRREVGKAPDSYPEVICLFPPDKKIIAEAVQLFLESGYIAE